MCPEFRVPNSVLILIYSFLISMLMTNACSQFVQSLKSCLLYPNPSTPVAGFFYVAPRGDITPPLRGAYSAMP